MQHLALTVGWGAGGFATVGGETQIIIGTGPAVLPQISSGRLRLISLTTRDASSVVPGAAGNCGGWIAYAQYQRLVQLLVSGTMEPKIIKTEEQHRAYLEEVDRLAAEDPTPGTAEGDRLELLAKLIQDYESERFKFGRPDPVEAILFRMDEKGLRQKDLAQLLGGKNRVSEILSRKRPLTLGMVRALSDALEIPADLLIGEPKPPRPAPRPRRRAPTSARSRVRSASHR